MDRVGVAFAPMSEPHHGERVTAHVHDGTLELRCEASPDEWIIAHDPVPVER